MITAANPKKLPQKIDFSKGVLTKFQANAVIEFCLDNCDSDIDEVILSIANENPGRESNADLIRQVRWVCMFARINQMVARAERRSIEEQIRVARGIRKKAAVLQGAEDIVDRMEFRISWHTFERQFLNWGTSPILKVLVLHLDALFRFHKIKKQKWEIIANIVKTTLRLEDEPRYRNKKKKGQFAGGEKKGQFAGGEWARQIRDRFVKRLRPAPLSAKVLMEAAYEYQALSNPARLIIRRRVFGAGEFTAESRVWRSGATVCSSS